MRQRVFVGCNLLQVKIGNAEYNCSCVRCVSSEYVTSVTSEDVWVIVGISAGSGLFLLVIIVIIIVVVVSRTRRRRDGPNNESNNVARSIRLDVDVYDNRSMTSYDNRDPYGHYYSIVPDDNDNNTYYSTGPAQPSENNAYSALDIPTYLGYSEDEF